MHIALVPFLIIQAAVFVLGTLFRRDATTVRRTIGMMLQVISVFAILLNIVLALLLHRHGSHLS